MPSSGTQGLLPVSSSRSYSRCQDWDPSKGPGGAPSPIAVGCGGAGEAWRSLGATWLLDTGKWARGGFSPVEKRCDSECPPGHGLQREGRLRTPVGVSPALPPPAGPLPLVMGRCGNSHPSFKCANQAGNGLRNRGLVGKRGQLISTTNVVVVVINITIKTTEGLVCAVDFITLRGH